MGGRGAEKNGEIMPCLMVTPLGPGFICLQMWTFVWIEPVISNQNTDIVVLSKFTTESELGILETHSIATIKRSFSFSHIIH